MRNTVPVKHFNQLHLRQVVETGATGSAGEINFAVDVATNRTKQRERHGLLKIPLRRHEDNG